MKKLIALTSAVLATSALSTAAFADNINDDLRTAESRYNALATEASAEGYQVGDLYGQPMTTSQKLDVISEKSAELKGLLNTQYSAN